MKKLFSMVLATIMIITFMFTGCSNKSTLTPEDPVTLTMWHVYGEQADSPMNRLVDEFNSTVGQEKGIIITVTNVTSTSKIGSQLLDAQSEKPGSLEMPDLFSAHTITAMKIGSDHLINWNDYFSQEELSNFVPEFIEDGTMDGKLTVFPISKSSYALYINGSKFDQFASETGVNYDMLDTWEGFFDVAEKYYEWSGGKAFCAYDYLIRHIELDMLAKNEVLEYTEDGWYDFESEALKTSWNKFASSLVQGHTIISDLYANTQVMTGETLAGIGSTAAVNYYNDTVTYPDNTSEPMDLHVLPLPKTGNGTQYMPQTGVGLSCFKTTEQKAEAASIFLHWFTEGERNLDFVVETGYMPVNNASYDAIDTYKFPDKAHASLYKAIRTMRENYIPVVRPDFDGYFVKVNTLYEGLREMTPMLCERLHQGEDIHVLIEETWDFFKSIQ